MSIPALKFGLLTWYSVGTESVSEVHSVNHLAFSCWLHFSAPEAITRILSAQNFFTEKNKNKNKKTLVLIFGPLSFAQNYPLAQFEYTSAQ